MGAGIPGTGMAGLDIAAGLGTLCGRSQDGLEVLRHVDTRALNAARKGMLETDRHIIQTMISDKENRRWLQRP